MPILKTKTTAKGQGRRRDKSSLDRAPSGKAGKPLDGSSEIYLVRDDRPTHVVVPIEEYERLSHAIEAQELAALAEDKTVKWVKASDAAIQIAGSWIAKARKTAGLTQKQLAQRMGVPQSQISRIEKNPDRTTLRTMKRIAAALSVDAAKLLTYADRED